MGHVLVIDDDPLFREIAREMLVQEGHDVTLAENGLLAQHVPAEPAPHLAIVDMLMPERDGIETIGDLRRRWNGLKVIAVSAGARGLESGVLLRAAEALGADAAMKKPLESATFLHLVRSLIG
jgi:CheY-like chemotaxis protein